MNVVNGALTLTANGGVASLLSGNNVVSVNGATGLTMTANAGNANCVPTAAAIISCFNFVVFIFADSFLFSFLG